MPMLTLKTIQSLDVLMFVFMYVCFHVDVFTSVSWICHIYMKNMLMTSWTKTSQGT